MESFESNMATNTTWRIPHVLPVKMDRIDHKLVAILQQNGRVSLSELGHYLHISKAGILYRLTRLEEKGVIRGYSLHVDTTRFQGTHTIFLLHHTHPEHAMGTWVDLLAARDDTQMVLTLFGTANTLVWATHATQAKQNAFREWVQANHASIIQEWEIKATHFFPLNYSGENVSDFFSTHHRSSGFISCFKKARPSTHVVSPRELMILRHLQKDSRQSFIELEKKTLVGRMQIKKNIQTLITNGIIGEFSATINPYAFDHITYSVLWTKFNSDKEKKLFHRWLARQNNANMLLTISDSEFLSFVYFKSLAQITRFEDDLRRDFNSLSEYTITIIREQRKLDWLPEEISTTPAKDDS